jgi:hypothetical protein
MATGGLTNPIVNFRGPASAVSFATTAAGQQATATATGNGASGIAVASATTLGSIFTNINADATSQIGSTATSRGMANITGTPVAIDTSGLNAYASASGLPSGSFIAAAFATHPNTEAAFGSAGATVLGAGAQGALYASDALGPRTYDASVEWDFDSTHLLGHLLVGLLDGVGSSFTSLHFTITEDGTSVIDQLFSDAASAESYFSDHVLDLGTFVAEPDLQLVFDLSMIGNNPGLGGIPGDGFGEDFLFGAASSVVIPPAPGSPVPEPCSLSLLALGGAAAAWLRWRRSSVPSSSSKV